jgi:hypothetical protein
MVVPLQIRFTEREPVRLSSLDLPYGISMLQPLEFGFIVGEEGDAIVLSPEDFACRDASCRPPTSGGTGGSAPKSGAGAFKRSSPEDLDLLFPGRRDAKNKSVHDDGTFSVEGLSEDGSFKTFSDKTEAALEEMWSSIGPTKDQYVANMVIAGQLAMGIDPATGKVNATQAATGHRDSKWYTVAHNDCKDIANATDIDLDSVVAATAALSAGRLWSGTKNGNIETARALADLVKNPIDIEIGQQHIDMMNWRREKSTKGVGKAGLDTSTIKPGKVNSNDLDSSTLVELLYAVNTLRGHGSMQDWMDKTSKDGKPGMKSSREQTTIDPPYPYFTSKGTQQVKQAVAVLRGEVTPRQAISGPKYSSFYSNIRNPDKDFSSTNDTWHYRIMAGNLPLSYTRKGQKVERSIVEHSIKDRSPDGMIVTTQDIFQRGVASKKEGLSGGDGMFRDTTRITRQALDQLKQDHPTQFGNMKIHEFQALIWVHYGGGQTSDAARTTRWYNALDMMPGSG